MNQVCKNTIESTVGDVPAIFMVDGCVIDLQDVAAVICAVEIAHPDPICRVILRSGASFNIDMRYSRAMIQAVEWSRAPGTVIRPEDEGAVR